MNNFKGFTLIELMVVVVILAILAAIALPSYANYITKSKIKEAQTNLIALSLSAEHAYQRHLSFPNSTLANTAAIQTHPVFSTWKASSDTFTYQYQSTDGASYTLTAIANEAQLAGCTLTLSNQGTRTLSGCGPVTEWTN